MMFELQDYYVSDECGSGWETEAIQYTFKNMQLLGYEVKLYKPAKKGSQDMIEVDLSKLYVKPCKEVKKEIKRNKKRAEKDGEESDEGDPSKGAGGPPAKKPNDEEAKGYSTPQVIDGESGTKAAEPKVKKLDGFMQRALARVAGRANT